MKKLYTFKVPFKTTKEVKTEKVIDEKPVTLVEKVDTIEDKEYFIRKPARADYDEAEFFYDKLFSYNVRNGIVTRSEIIKRFSNDDVVIKKVYDDYIAKENEFQRISLQEKTEENLAKQKKTEQELLNILIDIQNFELNKSSVFDRTAENRARTKTIFWWILNLAYKVDKDKEFAMFDGSTYEEKIEQYDKLLENSNEHITEVMQKFLYLIPAWYAGQINTEEDFKKAEDYLKIEVQKAKQENVEAVTTATDVTKTS